MPAFNKAGLIFAYSVLALTSACQTTQPRVIVREVARPCPVAIPARPMPLERPLPDDAVSLAAVLGEKLLEWAGPGGFGDRAESAIRICKEAR